ncbi:hypothetical protein RI367_001232 [Sorochytrium milnesiophthora]
MSSANSEGTVAGLSPQLLRALSDRLYEKRKAAALEIERFVRDIVQSSDVDIEEEVGRIVATLTDEFINNPASSNARNGGLIALAAVSIAVGPALLPHYLGRLLPPILSCFEDSDSRVRYYACESLYNVAKVARSHVLGMFTEIFDVLSKLSADTEVSVKNGAELLDRLMKDIVAEHQILDGEDSPHQNRGVLSLNSFIPLLQERIWTLNPATRIFLVSWLSILNSVPEVELVSFLPEFLAGMFKFLCDDNEQVRTITASLLSEFLREIKEAVHTQRRLGIGFGQLERELYDLHPDKSDIGKREAESGNWVPAQSVRLDFPRMVDILRPFLLSDDQETKATALEWLNEFIVLGRQLMLPFTPKLIMAILPSMSKTAPAVIMSIATTANNNLFELVANTSVGVTPASSGRNSPIVDASGGVSGRETPKGTLSPNGSSANLASDSVASALPARVAVPAQSTPHSVSRATGKALISLDLMGVVSTLVELFESENEETRIASLEWIIMLHKKIPQKIITEYMLLPSLIKIFSDNAEEVVRRALLLVAQICTYSEPHFEMFVRELLALFSRDRKLLESRGSLIVRQLSLALNPEKVYRLFAEILEKEEDLEFASTIITNLNLILSTAVELTDLRRRLKNLEAKEGQQLFITLYKSWCHSPISTFSLCLMAQAYEHASNLLSILADMEITVNLLIQVDKLVQLLESPVFTYLRLQLLEPEKYPSLFKCLYGLLMLLPQSSAFATLRNRLNSVSSMGFLHLVPRNSAPPSPADRDKDKKTTTRTIEPVKFNELLVHFRTVQAKHEKARRALLSNPRAAVQRKSKSSKDASEEGRSRGSVGSSAAGAGSGGAGSMSYSRTGTLSRAKRGSFGASKSKG